MPPEKRDPNLLDKLAVERDGIFMWALTGLKRLMANSYIFSETDATRAELQRYKVESNSVLSFVEDCCELDENAESIREELFQQYREYCNKNGLKPMSQANFNKDIESLGERVERGFERVSRRKTWRGIRMI